jgi:hypothetical protein
MRKELADYHFYKISCIDDDIELCYVGSTSNWKQRNSRHKDACNNENNPEYNQKKYQTIRENGGWDNFKMVEINFRENLTLTESRQIEEEYRVEHRATLNQVKCFQNTEEKKEYKKNYNEVHKEEIKEYHKEYYQKNIEKIKEKKKEYQKKYYQKNKEKKKEYQKSIKEERKEYMKQYYETNKDKLKEKKNEKFTCDCGAVVRRGDLSRHLKSKNHLSICPNI